jgi:hypothetical protein
LPFSKGNVAHEARAGDLAPRALVAKVRQVSQAKMADLAPTAGPDDTARLAGLVEMESLVSQVLVVWMANQGSEAFLADRVCPESLASAGSRGHLAEMAGSDDPAGMVPRASEVESA